MRTVSGTVVCSNPISLSKAAKIMSGFAAVDNGASDAVRLYLRRSSDAFSRLGQLHKKKIKTPIKTDALADSVENTEDKKVQKSTKCRDLEASQLVTEKIEGKKNQDFELGSNNEDVEVTYQWLNKFSGKKRKKTDKKERKQNEEPFSFAQFSDHKAANVQALEARDNGEKIDYEGFKKDFDGSCESEGIVKRNKKKRKRNEVEERKKELRG